MSSVGGGRAAAVAVAAVGKAARRFHRGGGDQECIQVLYQTEGETERGALGSQGQGGWGPLCQ
jgi:hypothetical protein